MKPSYASGKRVITIELPDLPKRAFANNKYWNLVANDNYSWASDCKSHEHLCSIKTLQGFSDYREVEPPKAKEWPQVGDEVEFPSGKGVLCVCEPDSQGIVIVKSEYEDLGLIYKKVSLDAIKKPKTEQELKIEELQTKLCNLNAVDNYILASEIVMGNVEGLSYE